MGTSIPFIVRFEIRVEQQKLVVNEVYRLGKKSDDAGSTIGLQLDKKPQV